MIVICPKCNKETDWESEPRGPFCSERCRLLDLGAWLDEEYRIETDEVDDGSPGGSENEIN